MGEAVLRQIASQRGIEITVDSAGTSAYHEGEEPDERLTPYVIARTTDLTREKIYSYLYKGNDNAVSRVPRVYLMGLHAN